MALNVIFNIDWCALHKLAHSSILCAIIMQVCTQSAELPLQFTCMNIHIHTKTTRTDTQCFTYKISWLYSFSVHNMVGVNASHSALWCCPSCMCEGRRFWGVASALVQPALDPCTAKAPKPPALQYFRRLWVQSWLDYYNAYTYRCSWGEETVRDKCIHYICKS